MALLLSKQKSYKSVYENGQIHCHSFYQNGKLEGENKCWYQNGQLNWIQFYRNGKLEGENNCFK